MLMWVTDLGAVGIVKDPSPLSLPPNAWTNGSNVAFQENQVRKAAGSSSFLTTTVPGYGLYAHKTAVDTVFTYLGLTKAYGFNANQHLEITRVAGDYGGTALDTWQGTDFNDIVILNNGVDIPQAWINPDPGVKLVNLANWPANTTAKVIRGYKNFLVAVDVTKNAIRYPMMVKWSHSAPPGSVPSSWDETDPALDAGEDIVEGTERIIDAVGLGDNLVLYTSSSTTAMRFVGGTQRMAFAGIYDKLGILAQQCALPYGRQHFVVSLDDIVLHALSGDPQSIVDNRLRTWFFANINPQAYSLTKIVPFAHKKEIWVMFPGLGSTVLNMALVWNTRFNSWSVTDLSGFYAAVELLSLSTPQATWGAVSGTWDSDTATWDVLNLPANIGSIIAVAPGSSLVHVVDDTVLRAGIPFVSQIERTGLAYLPSKTGAPAIDAEHFKDILAVWPVIEGQVGDRIKVEVGTQDTPAGPVNWAASKDFTIGQDAKVDLYTSGRFLAVRFTDYAQSAWRLIGYALDVEMTQSL